MLIWTLVALEILCLAAGIVLEIKTDQVRWFFIGWAAAAVVAGIVTALYF
jgi:hypothetical protein